jgi:hypothetical protein
MRSLGIKFCIAPLSWKNELLYRGGKQFYNPWQPKMINAEEKEMIEKVCLAQVLPENFKDYYKMILNC